MKKELQYEAGTPMDAPSDFQIRIVEQGPFLLSGKMPVRLQTIVTDRQGISVRYQPSRRDFQQYDSKEPLALCRCGASKHKPYCDGSHEKTAWDGRLTAPRTPPLDEAELTQGPTLTLSDAERYCAYARFCDAHGRTWNLTEDSDNPQSRELAIETASLCPAGRLKQWDAQTGEPIEPRLAPEIGLIEDPALRVSGPIWVKGGIPITAPDGFIYQVRNRVTLCRCGNSSNKPFCDGTHATSHFHDGLNDE